MLLLHFKKNNLLIIFLLGVMIIFFSGCFNNDSSLEINTDNDNSKHPILKEPLIKINKNTVRNEEQEISDYISRHNLKDIKKTGTGLRYQIYYKGKGKKKIEHNSFVKLNYSVGFLNGNSCYSSAIDGPLTFRMGKAEVETGLEEGVKLLNEGDKAIFIIPYMMAYGILGDGDRIPPGATLVYNVELLKIK
jgi:FKBP-type peptidyl-prolyl cis-trans isomerase FkpA